MVWHDCKTDPPKEDSWYLLLCDYGEWREWYRAYWNTELDEWLDYVIRFDKKICYKWAEVDLSEVE